MQVNGFAGVDFLTADVEEHRRAGEALARTGALAYQPTLITGPLEQTGTAIGVANKARTATHGARMPGVHLEGPFLSPDRPGTHPVDLLRTPDTELLRHLAHGGSGQPGDTGPELAGALDLVDFCVRAGVLVSCGHSNATAPQAHAAFDRGARLVTHLFDAMCPFTHRDPGIAGVALTREDVTIGVIADPSHLSAEAVRRPARLRDSSRTATSACCVQAPAPTSSFSTTRWRCARSSATACHWSATDRGPRPRRWGQDVSARAEAAAHARALALPEGSSPVTTRKLSSFRHPALNLLCGAATGIVATISIFVLAYLVVLQGPKLVMLMEKAAVSLPAYSA